MSDRSVFEGEMVTRKEPCRICGSLEGIKVAETEFWDLQESNIVQCNSCRLIQLDPMLTAESTAKGCQAYYLKDIAVTPVHEQMRNLVRNYRRGIVFGSALQKKGYHPENILEFGPGSGYFSAGVRYIFPESEITVADIVDDVLQLNREIHGYEAIKGSPEDIHLFEGRQFDLIIARDILEHVTDIGKVAINLAKLLKSNGLLHFITPNGQDDVWGHFLNWKFRKTPSELLINHVNYFDGAGLLKCLTDAGFNNIEYYTYQLKYRLRGLGWKNSLKLAGAPSTRRSGEDFITAGVKDEEMPQIQKEEILNSFIFKVKQKRLLVLYCRLKHHWLIHLNPKRNIGHEIYGLFIKTF